MKVESYKSSVDLASWAQALTQGFNIALNLCMENCYINECNKDYVQAVQCYEEEIAHGHHPNVNAYINLAFIYWSFAAHFFEFIIPYKITDEWSLIGGNRFMSVIELGLQTYPESLELHFWKGYLPSMLFGEEFSQTECEELIKKYHDDKTLIPFFFLYLFDNEKYRSEKDKLLQICMNENTAKCHYIESIIKFR